MRPDTPTLLLVEDDPVLSTFLADNLTADGFELVLADCVRDGLRELEFRRPDLAIVDLGLPDGSGLELLARVRDGRRRRLAARPAAAADRAVRAGRASSTACAGSSAGLTTSSPSRSPTASCGCGSPPCCGARASSAGHGRLRVGELELDPAAREVRLRGRRIDLSQKEFALLRALAAEPTRVLTKEELLRDVWGFRSLGTTRTLDSHACRLRHKLGADGDRFVVNVWGVGYRLVDGPVEARHERARRDAAGSRC